MKSLQNGKIYSLTFISSPDIKVNRPKKFQNKNDIIYYINNSKKESKNCDLSYISVNGGYSLINCRVFKMTFTTKQIKQLALRLCTYLAQPIKDNWENSPFDYDILVA